MANENYSSIISFHCFIQGPGPSPCNDHDDLAASTSTRLRAVSPSASTSLSGTPPTTPRTRHDNDLLASTSATPTVHRQTRRRSDLDALGSSLALPTFYGPVPCRRPPTVCCQPLQRLELATPTSILATRKS
jgi:hypothetical protein